MSRKLTKKEFIDKAEQIHGNEYDYSLVNYCGTRTPIDIICKIHGTFQQKPNDHLNNRGCTKCGNDKKNRFRKLTKETLIKKAEKIHCGRYDYSLVNYINNRTKVKIICEEHGIFEQTPDNHLAHHGCKFCIRSKGEITIENFLKEKQILHQREFQFENCVGLKRKLPFDFYLSQHNVCIEFDGEQHFINRGK